MKVKFLDELPFRDDVKPDRYFLGGKKTGYNIKDSKSFMVFKNNLIVYLEMHKVPFQHLQQDDNVLKINPFANYKILRVTKDLYQGHRYSKYKIKIDFAGFENKWMFIDLNRFDKLRLDFNANYTILNKSNIHSLIYGIAGGVIGAMLLRWLIGSA